MSEPNDKPEVTRPETGGVPHSAFRTFVAVNRRLATSADLESAMRHLLDAAESLTGARASYLLVERDGAVRLELGSTDERGRAFSRSLANKAISEQRTLTAADAIADRGLMEMPSVRELRVRSALCAPFRSATGTAGALYVEHPGRSGAFGTAEAEYLEILADQAAIAVDRRLHEEELAHQLARSERDLAVATRNLGRRQRVNMIGDSPAMAELSRQIDRFATADLPVLVLGETGSGKELVARLLHERSARHSGPFVSENCSAIPADLIESELFGHVKGAFTGADRDRTGLFELSSGGTLFLDEIGDMPAAMQTKLLRALQEGRIRRVGGSEETEIDLRLISATHRDVKALIAAGDFREDLYYRIAAGVVRVPPLSERGDDVVLLAEHTLERLGREHGRKIGLADGAADRLRTHTWPGNVRELEHVLARAFLLADGDTVSLDDLPAPGATEAIAPTDAPWPVLTLEESAARTIRAALRATGGEKTKAAKLLGISRTALYDRLKRLERPEA